jgi:predicted RNA-binding Zn-ribbon protein involved in translation (DUF1610 family)
MKLSKEELEEAKRQAAKYLAARTRAGKETDCPRCGGSGSVRIGLGRKQADFKRCPECAGEGKLKLSEADRVLLTRYPRHTLAQAREIDSARPYMCEGITSGFEKIIAQERGNFHLSGDHT